MKDHCYYVYLLTNKGNQLIYTGVTNDLERRMFEHQTKYNKGFTAKYNCNKLVYYEEFQWIDEAIHREKQIKGGSRQKKIDLINAFNADWNDLSADWFADDEIASVVPPSQ